MTDDPRLEAVTRAWISLSGIANDIDAENDLATHDARLFCAMARAFLGEDAERKEVSNHTRGSEASADNATVAGADPPWLDEAARAMDPREWDHASPSYRLIAYRLIARHQVRAVLRVANAQPVSTAEIEAATNVVRKKWGAQLADYWIVRAALEAAAKVRAGG